MRISRIKFKEIEELRSWISLLIGERDFNSLTQSNAVAKINAGEYVENDLNLFAITLEELKQTVRRAEEDNELISNLIRSKKLELRLKLQERDRLLARYKDSAETIVYKPNKKDQRFISVRRESLDRIVDKILYNINREKDTLDFVVVFDDGTIHTKSTKLEMIDKLIVKEG